MPGVSKKIRETESDLFRGIMETAPEFSEYFSAAMSNAFERTTTGMALTGRRVYQAEQQAAGGIGDIPQMALNWDRNLYKRAITDKLGYIAREDWNESHPYYREGVEWREDMTEQRARVYAEEYDQRQLRELILARGEKNYSGIKATGGAFLAGLLGSVPDPVNLLPMGGAAIRGGTLLKSVARGGWEGAAGNALADALVLPDLASRGADVGFADFALDVTFGAALGGFLGFGGWGTRRFAAWRRETPGLLEDFSSASGPSDVPEGAGRLDAAGPHDSIQASDRPEPGGDDRTVLTKPELLESNRPGSDLAAQELRNPLNDRARRQITGQNRDDLLRASALAVEDLAHGRAVEVSQVLRESAAIGKLYDLVLFNPETIDGTSPQVRLAYAELARELDIGLGDIFVDAGKYAIGEKGEITIPTNFGMFKFIWLHGEKKYANSSKKRKPHKEITREDLTAFPLVIRQYLPGRSKNGGYSWIVEAQDGRYINYVVTNFDKTVYTGPGGETAKMRPKMEITADGRSHLVSVYTITKKEIAELGGLSKKVPAPHPQAEVFASQREIPRGELTNSEPSPKSAGAVSRSSTGRSRNTGIDTDNIDTAMGKVNRWGVEETEKLNRAPEIPDPAMLGAYDRKEAAMVRSRDESAGPPHKLEASEELVAGANGKPGQAGSKNAAAPVRPENGLARAVLKAESGSQITAALDGDALAGAQARNNGGGPLSAPAADLLGGTQGAPLTGGLSRGGKAAPGPLGPGTAEGLSPGARWSVESGPARLEAVRQELLRRQSPAAMNFRRVEAGGGSPDFTDRRSGAFMKGLRDELLRIRPQEQDYLYVPRNTARTLTEIEKEARNLKHYYGINAVPVEVRPSEWGLRIEEVPPAPPLPEARRMLEEAYEAMLRGEKRVISFGVIGPEEAARIRERGWLQALLCKRKFSTVGIIHANSKHAEEMLGGQLNVNKQDFMRYAEVLLDPHDIEPSMLTNSVRFVRRYPEGTVYASEMRVRNNTLEFKSMWKHALGAAPVLVMAVKGYKAEQEK